MEDKKCVRVSGNIFSVVRGGEVIWAMPERKVFFLVRYSLIAMDLVKLQNTCKKKDELKNA